MPRLDFNVLFGLANIHNAPPPCVHRRNDVMPQEHPGSVLLPVAGGSCPDLEAAAAVAAQEALQRPPLPGIVSLPTAPPPYCELADFGDEPPPYSEIDIRNKL